MFVYNINLAIVFTMFLLSRFNLDSNGYKFNSKILNVIAFMSMWIVSGFRYFVGTDFEMYQNYYINIENINFIFIATILQFLGIKSILLSRMVYYVSIYSIVLIPNILTVIDKKLRPIYYILVLVFFYLVNLTLLLLNQSNVLPYIYKGL